jgi:hypothetical protein
VASAKYRPGYFPRIRKTQTAHSINGLAQQVSSIVFDRLMKPKANDAFRAKNGKAEHPLQWLVEPLLVEPTFELKAWFGGRTVTLDGRHHLVLTVQGEPWQGILVCTSHEHHASLRAEFPALVQHPVLGKWLYLSETTDTFERDARRLVQCVRARDPRLGILPSHRKKRVRRIRFGQKL